MTNLTEVTFVSFYVVNFNGENMLSLPYSDSPETLSKCVSSLLSVRLISKQCFLYLMQLEFVCFGKRSSSNKLFANLTNEVVVLAETRVRTY